MCPAAMHTRVLVLNIRTTNNASRETSSFRVQHLSSVSSLSLLRAGRNNRPDPWLYHSVGGVEAKIPPRCAFPAADCALKRGLRPWGGSAVVPAQSKHTRACATRAGQTGAISCNGRTKCTVKTVELRRTKEWL